MDFLKKRLKRLTSMGLALLLSASAFPATAFAASDSTSTLAEVTAKYIDAENGKEIAEQEIYSVTHEERQPQEIENYTYVDYTENVEYVYSHKDLTYIVGYPDESVRPDASMTRAEATTVFYRLYDGEYPEFERRMSNGTFEDVKTDYWFYKEVETLYNIGIVDGTDEHKFSLDAPVTRAEFAVMAARFANLDYEGGNLFDDVPNGHWAYSYINAAANAGWVEGYPDGSFRPDEPISRAEVVRLVNGMINRNVTLDKLKELGIDADTLNLNRTDVVEWHHYDRVVIGASIRYGHFHPAVDRFVKKHLASLQALPGAFFSVNLVARKPEKRTPQTNSYTRKFLLNSPWQPQSCAVFAGALRYPRYSWYDRFMIRLIMKMTGGETDTRKEVVYTDWQQVSRFAREIAQMARK